METNQLPINYIKHHVEVKKALQQTKKCRPNHISVYEALFSLWNHYRFPSEFSINRAEMMKLSCIGSKNTYTKVMKQLHEWNIVHYAGWAGLYDLTPGCKRRKGKRVENSSDKVPGDITPLIAEWKKKAVCEVYVSGLSLPGDTRIVKAGGSFGGVDESMAGILDVFGKGVCEDLTRPIIASAEGITLVAMPMRIPEAEMERAIKDMERLVG